MSSVKIHDMIYKQIIYLMYTSRSFGLSPKPDAISKIRRNAVTIKISNIIAYTIATIVSASISLINKNAPFSFIFLDLIILANIFTTGLNVIFFVTNYDLKTFLLSLPLTERDINIAVFRGIFEFFYYGFLASIVIAPISTYMITQSILQALMVELEIIFFFSLSFALIILLGKRIRLGVTSALFRVGTSLIWIIFILLPYGFTFRYVSLPSYVLPIFPFGFLNVEGLLLSLVYTCLSIIFAYNQALKFLSFKVSTHYPTKYNIKLQSPLITYLYKDMKGLLRVPQASFLLTVPVFALIFSFFAPVYAIFYVIFMITTSSIMLILLEASGLQLLLSLPSRLRSSYISKLLIILIIYLVDVIIFSFFGHAPLSLIMLPSSIASVELSLFISYNNVIKGKGIRIADPLSLLIREIEINSIVGIAALLLFFTNVYYSLIFSLISLLIINIVIYKKIK
ncbi:permease [Sulfolobus sp. E5-1-F]|uniref:permease n=1 Tax=Saccharolobus sp. E5-1-F TaxID=2663019 RepID=UPI001294B300|nr:permease [Sulfolobus sp. E5-1-F]QGA53282.1 permease [Sulfolobus sp. E5-1-F]